MAEDPHILFELFKFGGADYANDLGRSSRTTLGTTYHGPITKDGSHLRWILNQCVRIHIKTEPDGTVAMFYQRLARKKGDQKAIVAASAKRDALGPLRLPYAC